ncbi:TOG array regulator of axonemal microtubules protein 2-like isoform X4 [Corvus moneduloides]|uniref:Uncharacterized protein n=1 Tax=Corvus moneduloides TaxID=1196302 RepID=A0A8U7MCW7_CORMO|nr:TOG array regulator of axonemal microtubules protein 2-like isoform X4 [Corvus moneduloides]
MALERSVLHWAMLAQRNLERMPMELLEKEIKTEREKETSLQLPPQTVDPGDAAAASFSLPPVNGTASSVQRKHPGSALKKKVLRKQDNVPLLSKKPIIHGDGSFPRNSSVTPQTATGAERREEPLRGKGQKDGASLEPQQSLLEALSLLSSDDWELKEKGLFSIKHLAESHSEVLLCRLREVCLALTNEVTNLRSKVSYSAIVTLGELFVTLQKDMDSEVDEVARVLLQMVWNSPEFVQKAASHTLGVMVEHVTPARAMTALMDSGVQSRHVQVRKCAAQLLLSLMEKTGVTKLAGTPRAERLAHAAGTLAQDCHKDTRHYGQEMVKMMLNHQNFKRLLEQSLSTRDLEDILTRMKKKASLMPVHSRGGDMKKGSLGPPLIPPIRKAVSPPVSSAAASVPSSPQLDFQESQEMRPRSSSRSKEKNSEHAASSESTTNTQRKKGKNSWCVIGPGMPLFPRELAELFGLEDGCAEARPWQCRSPLAACSGGLGPGAPAGAAEQRCPRGHCQGAQGEG